MSASPAEYDAPTQVLRDCHAVVYEGWSPSELHALEPSADILAPTHAPVTVPGKARLLLQPSMCITTFDVMHHFWDPHFLPPTRDRVSSLSTANVTFLAHEVGPAASSATSQQRLNKFIDPLQFLFAANTHDLHSTVVNSGAASPLSQRQQDDLLFRIAVDVRGGKRYVVERTESHIAALLSALRYSFPHLVVPFVTEVSISSVTVLLDFLTVHGAVFATYIPVQYFLFEQSPRAFVGVFQTLSEVVRQRIANEDGLFQQTKPKVSRSWFAFGSSATTSGRLSTSSDTEFGGAGLSFKAELDYMERDERIGKQLPERFRVKYIFVTDLQDSVAELLHSTTRLQKALADEGSAFEKLAEGLTELQAMLHDEPLPGWALLSPLDASSSGAAAITSGATSSTQTQQTSDLQTMLPPLTAVNKVVKGFVTVCSVLQSQVAVPMAISLRQTVAEVELHAMSSRQFLRSIILHAKFISEKEGIITGKEDIRDSPAASNPAVMMAIKELYARRRSSLRMQKATISEELLRSSRLSKTALARSCTIVGSLFHHLADAFDGRHYTDLLRQCAAGQTLVKSSSGETAAGDAVVTAETPAHPVLALLATVDKHSSSLIDIDS